MSAASKKLVLGTVQFGLSYGATNTQGQVASEEVQRILTLAAAAGIDLLDTAPAYGDSESVLGQSAELPKFGIVTKTPHLKGADPKVVVPAALANSLKLFKRQAVHGLLVHNADDLLGQHGAAFYETLKDLKARGLVKKIGFSAYTGMQARELCDRWSFDLVQLPVNAFDQRLLKDGTLRRLHNDGVEVHARSMFLQGVLLSTPSTLPARLAPLTEPLRRFQAALPKVKPLTAALQFGVSNPYIDRVVLGVTSLQELEEILVAAEERVPSISYDQFAIDDDKLVDPRLWPAN